MSQTEGEIELGAAGGAAGLLTLLVNSAVRRRILAAVRDNPADTRSLRDRLDEPRSTVHQNVSTLADHDLLTRTPAGYRPTWRGEVVLSAYERCTATVETAETLAPFFEYVPPAEIDLTVIEDPCVTTVEPNRPNAVSDRVLQLVADAETARIASPYLVPRFAEPLATCVTSGTLTLELLLTADGADLVRREYAEELRAGLESGNGSYFRTDEPIPYALLLLDGTVLLGAFDDGIPATVVELRSEAADRWASRHFERYREAATPLRPDDLG